MSTPSKPAPRPFGQVGSGHLPTSTPDAQALQESALPPVAPAGDDLVCDCQQWPTHVSNECPVHNLFPDPPPEPAAPAGDREAVAITPRMAEAGKAKLIELGYEGVEFTDAQKVYLAMLEASPAALAKAGRLAAEVKGDTPNAARAAEIYCKQAQPNEPTPSAPSALDAARKEVWSLLEDWSARVPGKDEARAALCSIRAVTRMTDKIDRVYRTALDEAEARGRRSGIETCIAKIMTEAERPDLPPEYGAGLDDAATILRPILWTDTPSPAAQPEGER